jgi:4-amino-4-deoxy-L-arabinose transferase-like glycosyltransferase
MSAAAQPAAGKTRWLGLTPEVWLVLLTVVVLFSGLGLRAPWPADEPRFTLVAKQMVQSGDYWFPHRGIEIYPDKPPMLMWLQAGFFHLTGQWNLAFLLPSLLAGLATLWLTFDLSKRLFGRRAARLSTFALLLCVHFTYQFKKAQIDPLLVLLVTASVYCFLRAMLQTDRFGTGTHQAARLPAIGAGTPRTHYSWLALGAICAGLGVITKGVGVIALLVFLPYAWARRQARGYEISCLKQDAHLAPAFSSTGRAWAVVAALFLLPIALWLGPLVWQVHNAPSPERLAYLSNILLKQTAQRYTNAWHHEQGFWYFPQVMLTLWMPLIFVLPWAWRGWWRRIRGASALKRIGKPSDARYVLLIGWIACVVLFFSLSKGKRDMYILPALPMFAVLCGPALALARRKLGFQRLNYGFAAMLAGLLFVAGVLALCGNPSFEAKFESSYELAGAPDQIWWLFAGVGGLGLLACAGWRVASEARFGAGKCGAYGGFGAFCSVMVLLWTLVFGWLGYPLLDGSSSARLVMQRARAAAGPSTQIGLIAWKEQNALQLQGPYTDFGFLKPVSEQTRLALAWLRAKPESRALFVLQGSGSGHGEIGILEPDVAGQKRTLLGQANGRVWWLVQMAASRPSVTSKTNYSKLSEPALTLERDTGNRGADREH